MSDTQTSLGKLIESDAQRDAIHIAVAPVVAIERMIPGQHIGFVDDGGVNVSTRSTRPLGVVDPFLKNMVEAGERFWMFLYPNTITSLRHNWTHPAFSEAPAVAGIARSTKEASEEWLRNFVQGADCPEYETVIAAAVDDYHSGDGDDYIYSRNDGEYLHFGGRDAHGEIPPEFWTHVENVTGRKISKRPAYFSCSC